MRVFRGGFGGPLGGPLGVQSGGSVWGFSHNAFVLAGPSGQKFHYCILLFLLVSLESVCLVKILSISLIQRTCVNCFYI